MSFSIEKIAGEFFEIGSEQRLSILLNLNEKTWTISSLAKELGATITEVHRNFGRLQKTGFIFKNAQGEYKLTSFGQIFCLQIPTIAFVSENKTYFENHDFGEIPVKFQHRLGELYEHKHIKGFVRVLEKWKEIHNNASKYVYNILAEVPYSKDIIDIVEEKLKSNISIHSVFAENAIVSEERKTIFEDKNFSKFIKKEVLVRKMIKQVSVVIILNEKESCVMFPSPNGDPDMSEMFYSKDSQFHEWCLDYFNFIWEKSSSFKESKLNEN